MKSSEKKGPYFTEEDLKQIRAAVQAVGPLEGYASITDFVEAAARRELRRLQRKYNDGRKWPGVEAGQLRPGRRTRAETAAGEDRKMIRSKSTRAVSQPMERILIQDVIPYEIPDRFSDLRGPADGQLTLPHHVYWGPTAECDLGQPEGVIKAYQAVLREGTRKDQTELLNADLLCRVWPDLMLPVRCRQLWEGKFPNLA
ncbi:MULTISPECIES: ParB family protein [unclassified Arthrobacter]|uniref:ParB family protein n=1 Tax=unclassified Arthrobacter TaxID=235627 RepID=UPI0037C11B6D